MRIGYGYDVHRLSEGRPLILGGVEVPFSKGLVGYSDADVLLHAICDALLGACALGDIGQHFPDTNPDFKDIDSRILLRRVHQLVKDEGWKIANVDATVVAEEPKLAPFIRSIRECIAEDLQVKFDQISVKATTSEGKGFEGRKEGISSRAVVLLIKNEHHD
ncbi:2-C-methyl-D-erythritol 2,4-cyclodiphosphate synthase [Aliifodinibius salicampi]|uniref:2-C-methyl-D-erythritol 2,4-cyclodiphosphate synthase n=1 Tax=Fodinibius salicampi TaxID=1920655 RepID=A0ABT3Q040_9BACT|nr:2-C-methyl-D-erythritol 2,4-cyclodiphosphate synthase [Fodinibius salicampi]MCW9713454.1 2-C-methyl-D-erythritol 2,4-cyclodiphosphate synthase [Fodinibius salicampi]